MRISKQNLVGQTFDVTSSEDNDINEESSGDDKLITLVGDGIDFENDRISCLLEEDNLHPDAPEDVIFKIKKDFEGVDDAYFEDLIKESSLLEQRIEQSQHVASPSSHHDDREIPRRSDQGFVKKCDFYKISQFENNERFDCIHCWKSFTSKHSIEKHMRLHIEKRFHCTDCGKKFLQKDTLLRHARKHTADGDRFHLCRLCSRVLLTPEGLRCHMTTHHTPRSLQLHRYKCKHCNKAFCHSSGLSRHLLLHSGVSYTCQICRKSFSDGSSFKRHRMKMHAKFPKTTNNEEPITS